MIILIGLGNPGKRYAQARHNVGMRIVRLLAKRLQPNISRKKVGLHVDITYFPNEKMPRIILAAPSGAYYMNESGLYIKTLIQKYRLDLNSLWIVHDDKDLPLGRIRINVDRGSAGHRGVESIVRALDSAKFVRFRIGIASKGLAATQTENFVLGRFRRNEIGDLKETLRKSQEAILFAFEHGIAQAMNKYNR